MPLKKNLLSNLANKYKSGGYALISPKSGEVAAYGKDIKILYEKIDRHKIDDSDKMVMFIPSSKHINVFRISISVRTK